MNTLDLRWERVYIGEDDKSVSRAEIDFGAGKYKIKIPGYFIYYSIFPGNIPFFLSMSIQKHLSFQQKDEVKLNGLYRLDFISRNSPDRYAPIFGFSGSVSQQQVLNYFTKTMYFLLCDILELELDDDTFGRVFVPFEIKFKIGKDKLIFQRLDFYKTRLLRQKLELDRLLEAHHSSLIANLYKAFNFQLDLLNWIGIIRLFGSIFYDAFEVVKDKVSLDIEVKFVKVKSSKD